MPEEEWPIEQDCSFESLPEESNKVFTLVEDSLTNRTNINQFPSCARLQRVTARVIAMYRRNPKLSSKNAYATEVPDQSLLEVAELLWIYETQHSIRLQVGQGQFKRLCPKICEDGLVVISGRVEKWMDISYDHQDRNLISQYQTMEQVSTQQGQVKSDILALRSRTRLYFDQVIYSKHG